MDSREALRDDGSDAEVQGCKRRLLSARALAVVVAADDDAAAPLLGASRTVGVEAPKEVAGAGGNVRPDGETERAVGRHVAGRHVIGHDDDDATLDRLGK